VLHHECLPPYRKHHQSRSESPMGKGLVSDPSQAPLVGQIPRGDDQEGVSAVGDIRLLYLTPITRKC
jgi:hypothetical protein